MKHGPAPKFTAGPASPAPKIHPITTTHKSPSRLHTTTSSPTIPAIPWPTTTSSSKFNTTTTTTTTTTAAASTAQWPAHPLAAFEAVPTITNTPHLPLTSPLANTISLITPGDTPANPPPVVLSCLACECAVPTASQSVPPVSRFFRGTISSLSRKRKRETNQAHKVSRAMSYFDPSCQASVFCYRLDAEGRCVGSPLVDAIKDARRRDGDAARDALRSLNRNLRVLGPGAHTAPCQKWKPIRPPPAESPAVVTSAPTSNCTAVTRTVETTLDSETMNTDSNLVATAVSGSSTSVPTPTPAPAPVHTISSSACSASVTGSVTGELVGVDVDRDRREVLAFIFGEKMWSSLAESRAIAVLLGQAIGDALGARLEFKPVRYGIETLHDMGEEACMNFGLKPGQWTDDNSMGLCLADSLLFTKGVFDPHDLMLRFQAWWNGGYNNAFAADEEREDHGSVGLGGNISMSMSSYIREGHAYTKAGDSKTSGNGSVMRNAAPVVCHHDNIEEAMEIARLQSLVTHQGEEASECCRLMAHIEVQAINGGSKRQVLTNLPSTFHSPCKSVMALACSQMEEEDPDRDWRWMADKYYYSPKRATQQPGYVGSYAMDALAMALHCLWVTNSFSQALLMSANQCGDADSVTSVTGQLAGSFYGASSIPRSWMNKLLLWDFNGDTALRAYYLFHHVWVL
ncbi:ADP-ribosylglycohydrolase family protein [Pelomyxa schiedti]|nr:ADP-ribosylglycohydrolase family protein [Pelomyxa schiedti]